MKIVFLADSGFKSIRMAQQLIRKGIPIEAVLLEKPSLRHRFVISKRRYGFVRASEKAVLFVIHKSIHLKRAKVHNKEFYKTVSHNVFVVDDSNGVRSQTILSGIKPDIIILGGGTIIRQRVLDIPTIGILNAHTGLLPQYRGMNCLAWSIYNEDDIGVTVHYIDAGIDTGPILTKRLIEISKGETLQSLWRKAYDVAGNTMADIVLSIINGEELPATPQLKSEGKQYYKMPKEMIRKVDEKVREIAK